MRRIKSLGLVATMALALTAFVGVTQASASEFEAPGMGAGAKTTWNGTRLGLTNHKLVLGKDNFSCSKVGFSGQMTGESSPDLTVTPEQLGCLWGPSIPISWTMNGCQYRLAAGSSTEENRTVGSLDITGCEKPMRFETGGCLIEIGNQKGLGTIEFKNTEANKFLAVQAVANLNSITYNRQNMGGCSGKTGTFSDGTYEGEWIVEGFISATGSQTHIQIHGSVLPAPTLFAAEEAPATIAGADSGMKKRISPLGGNGVTCEFYGLDGKMTNVTAESITVVPTYKGCKVGGIEVPDGYVNAGSCHFVIYVNGELDIAGEKCESNPMAITRAGCIATIGPQSGLTGFSLANAGSGKLRTVSMSGSTEPELTYTIWGPTCSQVGAFSNGKLQSTAKLTATNSLGAQQGFSVE